MKELTIKEKAKAYDEVVNKLKGFIMQGVDPLITRADVQDFFPELAESEDERIRNEIIAFVEQAIHRGGGTPIPQEQEDRWIAWLEKHGEKEQDERYENLEELLAADNIYQMAMNDEMVQEAKEKAVNALSEMCIGRLLGFKKKGEQKPTDNDMKEALRTEYEKGRADTIAEMQVAWSEEDEEKLDRIITVIHCYTGTVQEENELKSWLKSLKQRIGG